MLDQILNMLVVAAVVGDTDISEIISEDDLEFDEEDKETISKINRITTQMRTQLNNRAATSASAFMKNLIKQGFSHEEAVQVASGTDWHAAAASTLASQS
jgi:hypothetical protein